MKNLDSQFITLVAIAGVILLATVGIVVYGTEGKDITNVAITGLLGFAGGGAAGYAIGMKKEGREDDRQSDKEI